MLGSLLQLALVAGAGASTGGLQRTGRRVVIWAAGAIAVALIATAAVGCFAAAGWYALLPLIGPAWSALIIGLVLVIIALAVCAIAERRHRRLPPPSNGVLDLLPLAAAQLPNLDIRGTIGRHGVSVL